MAAPGKTILDEAKGLIFGDREEQYGDALVSFGNIADGWSVIMGTEVTPEKVCLAMAWLKTCRLLNQPDHHDSIVDSAGYAGCYEKVLVAREKRERAMADALAQAGGPIPGQQPLIVDPHENYVPSNPHMVAAMSDPSPLVDPRIADRHLAEGGA